MNVFTSICALGVILCQIGIPAKADYLDYEEIAEIAEPRTFNLTLPTFNGSILGIGAAIIIGIILFEIALYALDVYYNKTYGFGGSSTYSSGYGYGYGYDYRRSDDEEEYDSYAGVPLLYRPLGKYRDPYADTYRAFGGSSLSGDKILGYLALAHDAYEAGNSIMNNLECQKRIICEIYQDSGKLGGISSRMRRGLDFMDLANYVRLPSVISDTVEEFQDAKSSAKRKSTCQELFANCDVSINHLKERFYSI